MLAGLILAAGESSRMGQDKALLTYHGRTFLEVILGALRDAGLPRIAVVLGHRAAEIQDATDLKDIIVVINHQYRRGQTSSLQAGIKGLENPELEAIVLCLVDHPAISAEVVRSLIENFRTTEPAAVIPTYQDRHGHPVLIGRALFDELKQLGENEGANTVMRKYRNATHFVEVNDPGILLDVDDPEAYRQLTRS